MLDIGEAATERDEFFEAYENKQSGKATNSLLEMFQPENTNKIEGKIFTEEKIETEKGGSGCVVYFKHIKYLSRRTN